METLTGSTRRYSKGFRSVALLTALIFVWEQILLAAPEQISLQTQSQSEISVLESSEIFPSAAIPSSSSEDFLTHTLSLTHVEIEDKKEEMHLNDGYESDIHSFAYALELLRPEYAAAVIVKEITEEDIARLLDLDFEVAIVVLHGEIVLFSTGSEEEIGITAPARILLEKASFVSHTHITQDSQHGPSSFDFKHAVMPPGEEYVLTREAVYAYNRGGLLNEGKPQSYEWYLERLAEALTMDPRFRGDDNADEVTVRRELNEFIREMDIYNEASEEMKSSFRRSAPPPQTQNFYDSEGRLIRRLTTSYYEDGKTKTTDDYRYSAGVVTARYYRAYSTGGSLERYLNTGYHSDGKIKQTDDYYYAGSVLTRRYYYQYDTAGVKTRFLNTAYYEDGKIKQTDDYYYAGGVLTRRYYYQYDTAGVKTRFLNTGYYEDGKIKQTDDYYYAAGVLTRRYYYQYDTAGVKTRFLNTGYYENGKIKQTDDYYYAGSVVTRRYYYQYNSEGVKTRFLNTAYYENGKIKTADDYSYSGAVTTSRLYQMYSEEGLKTRFMKDLYHATGKVSTRDDYYYSSGKLTRQIYSTFDDTGKSLSVNTSNYPPSITTQNASYSVTYKVDGITYKDSFTLEGGEHLIQRVVKGYGGNSVTVEWKIMMTGPYTKTLQDGTQLNFKSVGVLEQEITPEGNKIFYRADQSVEKYVSGTSEIRYESSGIEIYNSGNLTETITLAVPSALNIAAALKMTLEGGVEAYYVNGSLKEMRMSTGIRVTDFILDSQNNIVNALIVYPDKTLEVIRNGKLLRRIYPDGSIMDFLPTGFAVRNVILSDSEGSGDSSASNLRMTEYYFYDKLSQTEIKETIVFTSAGEQSRYDEKGILREVKNASGEIFSYSRTQGADSYQTVLVNPDSLTLTPKTLTGASYDLNGVLQEMRFHDGTKISFTNSQIDKVLDAEGNPITDYTFTEEPGFAKGVSVNHSGSVFQYDDSGFLEQIKTASGTITRVAEDTDGDGDLTDEEITNLLLETVDGNKLSDFELDANGNIIKGIITTKEGIKQRIENGVMTGFETVDGKVYSVAAPAGGDFANNQAILKEWNFKDGTRIVYGGGTIQEILNPSGSKLHTIGFDSQKNVASFVEELGDGTKKYFETVNGKSTLTKLITPTGAVIHYGFDGLAEKIVLPDSTHEKVEYAKDANGNILEITFVGEHTHRTYAPDGTLLNLLTDGMNAEVVNGEVSTLFTRFGAVTAPDFSTDGIMSGTVEFVDGTKQVIENGVLIQTIRSTGTKVNYLNARISSLQRVNGDVHTIVYTDNTNGSLKDAKLRSVIGGVMTEHPLVPYLLGEDNRVPADPPHQMIATGDSKINSTAKFGSGSLLLDGSGDTLSTAMDSDFNFGTGDFTVDFWVRFNGLEPQYLATGQSWDKFSLAKDSHGYLTVMINGRGYDQTGWNPVTGTWYHVAMARKAGQIKTYINGTQLGGIINESGVINLSGDFVIGGRPEGNYSLNGRMDEFRITKGEALWSTNFTKPSVASQKTDNTKLLLHFDGNMNDEELPAIGWDKLPRPDSEIAEILFGRKLQNALAYRFDIQSNFATGNDIFFAEIKRDTERGTVYEFGDEWAPEWNGVSLNFSGINQGYITAANTIGYIGDHPQITSNFVDLNGDGLLDRVFMDPTGNFWWLQINDGNKFLAPQKWTGVDKNSHLSQTDYPAVSGSLRYFEGGSHTVAGDLIDITGDGLADRVVVDKNTGKWFVQKNGSTSLTTGDAGFDAFVEWEGNIHPFSQSTGSGQYGIQVRPNCDVTCYKTIQELAVDLIDLDGDGLLDRVLRPYVAPFTHWFWQKNTGTGFEDALLWEGVDNTFYTGPGAQDPKIAGAISWYLKPGVNNIFADISDLIDMNGDGKVDRVLTKQKDPTNPNSALDWYVQFNTGSGFDAAVLWDDSITLATSIGNAAVNSAIRITKNVDNASGARNLLSDLRDVTGDGLPDRVTVSYNSSLGKYVWNVEKNTGTTFTAAEVWTSIEAQNELEASLGQDLNHFTTYETPNSIRQSVALKDINGDEIQDRLIFRAGEAKWYVQLGAGNGFLPLEELKIEGLETSTESINTTRYDYLHVSLKAEAAISSSQGSVKVMLGDPNIAEEYQEWTVNNLTASWQDFYLPIDKTKANASQVKIKFIPASESTPTTPIYVENMTFTKFRPDATKDWLNRMLTEENVISEIHSDRTQTLAQYLGLAKADDSANNFWASNLEILLKAETRIDFDSAIETAKEFETFYGSVSKVSDGAITETTLPDGTKIQFSAPTTTNPNSFTQTITRSDGTVETNSMSYGRVRTVERPGKSPLQYSYEFDSNGNEITVVLDPDTDITERYIGNRLISRTEPNGVRTQFIYDAQGNHIRTQIIYMNRVRANYEHAVTNEGYRSVRHEDGVTEEYQNGKIVAHATPDGFRYVHSYAKAREVVTEYETKTVELSTGNTLEVQVPVVRLVDDPEGEEIHRVTLQSFKDSFGNIASYQDGLLASTKDASGLTISFDKVEEIEKTNEEDGSVSYEITPVDVTVFHEDGTITEFRNGKPYSITSATGRVISIESDEKGELLNPSESAEFHYAEALKLWQETVLTHWTKYQPSGSQEILAEYTMDGKMLVRQYAEGALELYGDNGRIEEVISREGERLVSYQYDSDGSEAVPGGGAEGGNPTRILMEGMRRNLEVTVARIKADIMVENQKAFKYVEEREQVISQTVEGQYQVVLTRLLAIRAELEAERTNLASLIGDGKKGKQLIGVAQAKLDDGFRLVDNAISQLAQNRIDALNNLETQVEEARDNINQQTSDAFDRVEIEKNSVLGQIVKQEYLPVIFYWYRKILGRDPSEVEYQTWLDSVDVETGGFNLEALKNELLTGTEYTQRSSEVQGIKNKVSRELHYFLGLSDSQKAEYAAMLGIEINFLMQINSAQAESILTWLNSQSLHFGQSAYLSLEAMLDDAGLARQVTTFNPNEAAGNITDISGKYSRLNIATRLILTDILTGTLTPLEKGDLVISLYTLRSTATKYGVDLNSYSMSYEALRVMYESQCGAIVLSADPASCNFRFVAHINANHFIIVTGIHLEERTEQVLKVDENGIIVRDANGDPLWETKVVKDESGNSIIDEGITFLDPGAGPEGALSIVESTKEEFLAVWQITDATKSGYGYVLSARGPPASVPTSQFSELNTQQEMAVRGAFFGWFLKLIAKVIEFVLKIVEKIVRKIGGIIEGIYDAIAEITTAIFGDAFQALKDGDFIGFHKEMWKAGVKVFKATVRATAEAFRYLFSKEGFSQGLILGIPGAFSKYVEVYLTELGVSAKTIATIVAGVDIVVGALAIAFSFGNPALISFGISQIAKGVGDLLLLHTDIDPKVVKGIQLGAQIIGAAVGQNPASFGEFLKNAAIIAGQEFASAGVVALGSKIGLDPRITALGVPLVRAGIGKIAGRFAGDVGGSYTDSQGNVHEIIVSNPNDTGLTFTESIRDSLFSSEFIGGAISLGASIGLEASGAPSLLQNFVPNILGNIVAGAGNSGGGGGPGGLSNDQVGKNVFSRILDNAVKFGQGVIDTVSNVIEFGAKVISDGFEKTLQFFSGIFDRRTQEAMNDSTNANGELTFIGGLEDERFITKYFEDANGDIVTAKFDKQSQQLTVLNGKVTETFIKPITSGTGLFGFEQYAYAEDMGAGTTLHQNYNNNLLQNVQLSKNGTSLFNLQGYGGQSLQLAPNGGIATGQIDTPFGSMKILNDRLVEGINPEKFWSTTYEGAGSERETVIWLQSGKSWEVHGNQATFEINYTPSWGDYISQLKSLGAEILDYGEGILLNVTHTVGDSVENIVNQFKQTAEQANKTLGIDPREYFAIDDLEPEVRVNSSLGIAQYDMPLQWLSTFNNQTQAFGAADIAFFTAAGSADILLNGLSQGISDAALGKLSVPPNWRWAKATSKLAVKLVETVRANPQVNMHFVPGVNSEGITDEDLYKVKNALQIPQGKKVIYGHSAGTDAVLKSLPYFTAEEKENMVFVFGSPRMDPVDFNAIVKAAGLRPDQVIVIGSAEDLPHAPYENLSKVITDFTTGTLDSAGALFDTPKMQQLADLLTETGANPAELKYELTVRGYGLVPDSQRNYQYVFLEEDVTPGISRKDWILDHGASSTTGILKDHIYNLFINGELATDKKLAEVLRNIVQQSCTDEECSNG